MRRAGLGTVGLGLLAFLIFRGLRLPPADWSEALMASVCRVAVVLFALEFALHGAVERSRSRSLRPLLPDAALVAVSLALLLAWHRPGGAFALVAVRQVLAGASTVAESAFLKPWMRALEARPAQLVVVSFFVAIALGTALLSLPVASTVSLHATFVDALFTATSAVCVTGLVVRSTPHDWSLFGQVVILCLIQIGGLGIMALSVSIVTLLGRRLRARSRAALVTALDASTVENLMSGLRYLVGLTLAFETVGLVVLTLRFRLDQTDWFSSVWLGLFHSISAWNNAGFALWDDSLTAYAADPIVLTTVAALIVAGGLGFAVVGQILDPRLVRGQWRSAVRSWSAHTKLVLTTTGLLLAGGTLLILFVEFDAGLRDLSPGAKIAAAAFHSVSARTAGFNTVDLAHFTPLGLLIVGVLMFVGASPGSTGGGIKTSTAAVLVLSIRSLLLNRDDVVMFRRRVPAVVVLRATAIAVIAVGVVLLFFGLMLAAEPAQPFSALLFETISAVGTVGLSTGITPSLGATAKLILTLLMFIGRTGPLTLALAIGQRRARVDIHYPEGQVVVG
ncbi:MAG: TrkH family potassium uptake protein [Acidobacteriota bacterium]